MRDPWGDPFDDLQMVDFPNTFLNWLEGKWSLSPHSKMFFFHPEHADFIDWCPFYVKIPFFGRYSFSIFFVDIVSIDWCPLFFLHFVDDIFPWTKPGYSLLFHIIPCLHWATSPPGCPKGILFGGRWPCWPLFFRFSMLFNQRKWRFHVHSIYCMYIYIFYIYIYMYVIHLINVTEHLM